MKVMHNNITLLYVSNLKRHKTLSHIIEEIKILCNSTKLSKKAILYLCILTILITHKLIL